MKIKKFLRNKNFDVNANFKIYDATSGPGHDDETKVVFNTLVHGYDDIPKSVLDMEISYVTTEVWSGKKGVTPVGAIIIEATH